LFLVKDEDEEKYSECHNKISEMEYDPSKKNYHPIKDAFWNHGQL
jgi:hypothetical protein